jgi:hypothetical protein
MKCDPPKKDIIEAWKEICRESGAVQSVGPKYYQWFAALPDGELSNLLQLIILDRADEINSWVFAHPRMKSEQDISDYLEWHLEMFALGFLQIRSDGRIGCYEPVGPAPTPAEDREIDHRIRSVRPLIRPAVFAVLKIKRK